MPKKVPAKANEEVQRKYLEETLAPLMKASNDDTPLYFVDGTHPSYTAHAAYGWIRKGKTWELKSNHGRRNISINGALSWPGREFVHRQTGRITTAEMILLFEDLQAKHPTASAIRVVLDNARYNHSKELKAWLACDDCRVELHHLPAYAPNLNLIERFWWLFKKETIYNKYFPTFAEFEAAVEGFFAGLDGYRNEILSLVTDKFNFVGKFNPQAPWVGSSRLRRIRHRSDSGPAPSASSPHQDMPRAELPFRCQTEPRASSCERVYLRKTRASSRNGGE